MILEDDKEVFPAGNVIFVTDAEGRRRSRARTTKRRSSQVQKGLTLPVMQELDARVELEKESAEAGRGRIPEGSRLHRLKALAAGRRSGRPAAPPASPACRSEEQTCAAQAAESPAIAGQQQGDARVVGLREPADERARRSGSSRGRRPSRGPSPCPASAGSTASCSEELIEAAKVTAAAPSSASDRDLEREARHRARPAAPSDAEGRAPRRRSAGDRCGRGRR